MFTSVSPCVSADENVVLESVQYRGQHVGVLPSGEIKEPGRTGTGLHAQFRLTQHKTPEVSTNSVCVCESMERIQWNPSNPDTNDTKKVSVPLWNCSWGTLLERSVLISGVSLEGGFHCSYVCIRLLCRR